MYWGTFHERRMVNGYSGFFPHSFLSMKDVMQTFPNPAGWELLQDAEVSRLVVLSMSYTREAFPQESRQAKREFSDAQIGIDIYRLPDPQRSEVTQWDRARNEKRHAEACLERSR